MRVLVCGGRDYADRERVFAVLSHYHASNPFSALIHGAATGADSLAAEWARANSVPVDTYPADWKKYGLIAGPVRNALMISDGRPQFVIGFPGGRGTANMLSMALRVGLPVQRIPAAGPL